MHTATGERTPALNIRIKSAQRTLIEQAARASGKTVSDFVREAALREAQNALLDRSAIELDAAQWERFVAALDAPPARNPRLRSLMARKPAWEG